MKRLVKILSYITSLSIILTLFSPLASSAAGSVTPVVYSEFTQPLIANTPVFNGANGTITLFFSENASHIISAGCLDLSLDGSNAYIRFTSSVTLTEDCATSKYKYMAIKLKGSAEKDGVAVGTGALLKIIFGSWGNEANPIYVNATEVNADSFSTLLLPLSDLNFAATHKDYKTGLIIKNGGNFATDVMIDSISFYSAFPDINGGQENTDEQEDFPSKFTDGDLNFDKEINILDFIRLKKSLAKGSEKLFFDIDGNGENGIADIVFYKKLLLGSCELNSRGRIYSDFSSEITEGSYVSSGEDDEKIELFARENADYLTDNGSFDVALQGERSYVRFLNTVPLADTSGNYYYDNMVITLRGGTEGDSADGNLLKIWFGAWGNEASAFYIPANKVNQKLYTKIVIPLKKEYFANLPADYVSGIFIMNARLSKIDISIDEIRFCDNAPQNTGITKGYTKLYKFPTELTAGQYHDVNINGVSAFVYDTNVNSRRVSPSGNAYDVLNLSKVGVVSFDMSGNTEIEISLKGKSINSVKISPQSEGIDYTVSDNKVIFSISRYGQYTVEFNGSITNALHIFANPIEADPVTEASSDVIYFAPGVHYANKIEIKSGQTLYLAGGAVVYGYAFSDADNITIRGRGYFDGSKYSRYGTDGYTGTHKVPINLASCNNVKIEGIACLDPCGWAYNLFACSNTSIKNVKVISSRQNGDGISVQSCSEVNVSKSFVRSWDDSLVIKNYEGVSTSNISFTDCIIWTDLAQSMEVGYETRGATMTDISFKNITVLHNFHKSVISVHNGDRAEISDVYFDNICLEDAQMGSGDGLPYLIDIQVVYSPVWSKDTVRGKVSRVYISNVNVLSGIDPKIRIEGYDSTHNVSNISLSNIYIKGSKISKLSDSRINIGNFVSSVTVN